MDDPLAFLHEQYFAMFKKFLELVWVSLSISAQVLNRYFLHVYIEDPYKTGSPLAWVQ